MDQESDENIRFSGLISPLAPLPALPNGVEDFFGGEVEVSRGLKKTGGGGCEIFCDRD